MAQLLRGDIVWAHLEPTQGNEQAGKRPVLIVSHEVFNKHSGTVIAMALTSQPQRAQFPLTLPLGEKNLPKPTWVKISQIRVLSVDRLGKRIARASEDELDKVIQGLNEIIA